MRSIVIVLLLLVLRAVFMIAFHDDSTMTTAAAFSIIGKDPLQQHRRSYDGVPSSMSSSSSSSSRHIMMMMMMKHSDDDDDECPSSSNPGSRPSHDNGSSRSSSTIGRRQILSSASGMMMSSACSSLLIFGKDRTAAIAAPEIFQTSKGVKYAVLKQAAGGSSKPQKGDIVAIEYTGYLTDGSIFDATHSEGKKNALVFELGGNAVIDGINDMVLSMSGVGEKVQAIVPPSLAFGDKGLCIESGECLIKPKSTLVYDIYLKKVAIPPP